ncbi:hypothetical protein R2362_03240 [Mycobacteroides chelonae]|nr:hypothetical protein [Mycobacteroides chelonae]
MKVKTIWFGDDEKPESAEVELSMRELAWIATVTRHQSWTDVDNLLPGYGGENETIYDALSGIFNGFWEDGVDGYLGGRG